jgi:N-acyl-D-amino-acid deacylase
MSRCVAEALDAGAFGFSSSRTVAHKVRGGGCVPGTYATEEEIFGIGAVLKGKQRGIFSVVPDAVLGEGETPLLTQMAELDWMRRLSDFMRRRVIYFVMQNDANPYGYRLSLQYALEANSKGSLMTPMVAARPVGSIFGLQSLGEPHTPLSYVNPFRWRPTFKKLADLPFEQMVAELRKPEIKQRLLREEVELEDPALASAIIGAGRLLGKTFLLGDPVEYEPSPDTSIISLAEREGRNAEEYFYDAMLEDDGRALFYLPLMNYAERNGDSMLEMMEHSETIIGGGDGGAHVKNVCDASNTTYVLSHWARGRTRGAKMDLESAVRRLTLDTASAWGMHDRGLISLGLKADLNLIDMDRLALERPKMVADLPAGGDRLVQTAQGYVATIKSGTVIMRDGKATGALPGRVVRSS